MRLPRGGEPVVPYEMPLVTGRFGPELLAVDAPEAARAIARMLVETVARRLGRRGAVLGVSGGIDSALCLALAAQALKPSHSLALLMPDRDTPPDAMARAQLYCDALGVPSLVEDITASLEALGCYRRRDAAVRRLFPDYGEGWRHKIAIRPRQAADRLPYFTLIVEAPDGTRDTRRLPHETYLEIVAATNFKQRVRKSMEYHHADRLNYAVIGTPNRLEYELGFFVRGGDGLADVKPIAHLYKTQVYALAECLGVPEEIRRQPPSTDTFSLPQTQDEFYFEMSYAAADLVLFAMNKGVPPSGPASCLGLTTEEIESVYRDFGRKQRQAARGLIEAHVMEPADPSQAGKPR